MQRIHSAGALSFEWQRNECGDEYGTESSDDREFSPVFITGPHRSGTTILYRILAETGLFNITTAYHVLNRHRLLYLHRKGLEQEARQELAELFARHGLKDREFDSVPITPDIPEEYAYALEPQGRRPMLNRRTQRSFLNFCRKVQSVQSKGRPLLLKNPFDAANFVYTKELLPAARFIYIHRSPADVVNSQIKTLRSLLERKNEYVALVVRRYRQLYEHALQLALVRHFSSDKYPLLFRRVLGNILHTNRYYLQNVHRIEGACYDVTYRAMCSDPNGTIQKILDFLQLHQLGSANYSGLISPRAPSLLDEVSRRTDEIRRKTRAYCDRFGF